MLLYRANFVWHCLLAHNKLSSEYNSEFCDREGHNKDQHGIEQGNFCEIVSLDSSSEANQFFKSVQESSTLHIVRSTRETSVVDNRPIKWASSYQACYTNSKQDPSSPFISHTVDSPSSQAICTEEQDWQQSRLSLTLSMLNYVWITNLYLQKLGISFI